MKWVKEKDVCTLKRTSEEGGNQREAPKKCNIKWANSKCKFSWPMSIYFHINRKLNNIIPIIVGVQIELCGTDLRNVNGRHRFSYINFHLSPSHSLCLSFAYRYFSLVWVEKKLGLHLPLWCVCALPLRIEKFSMSLKRMKCRRRIWLQNGAQCAGRDRENESTKRHCRQKAPSFVPDSERRKAAGVGGRHHTVWHHHHHHLCWAKITQTVTFLWRVCFILFHSWHASLPVEAN